MTDIATLGVRVTQEGIKEADANLKKMAESGEAAAQSTVHLSDKAKKLIGQIDPLVSKAAKLEKQYSKLSALRESGDIGEDVFQYYSKQIKASSNALLDLTDKQKKATLTAGQMTQSFRQLPMQMTDVFVGLTSGQSPLQVLIQQGGQLKDSFGGIGAASRAVGGYVMGMINPLTLAAAAIAGISTAALQGSKETENLANSLVLSGNRIGATTSELVAMTRDIADATGGTVGKASEALGVLAQMGATTKGQLSEATKSAIAFEKATGQALDETAKQFKALQDGPTKAVTELNKQYNFLTASTYKQIRSLEESGKKAEAARIATDEYTKALGRMATDVQNNAGILERAWNGIAGAAKGAWDAMLGIGRATTPADRIKKLGADLDQLMAWTPRSEKDNARRLESISKIGKELDTLISKQVEEQASAEASAKNARGVEATATAMDNAAKNAQKYKQALRELTDAYITAADQVLAFKTLDEQALEASVARSDALEKEAQKYRDIADPTRKFREQLEEINRLSQTMDPVTGKVTLSESDARKSSENIQKQIEGLQKTDDITKQLGLTFTSAFEEAIAGGKGFRDILEGILQDMVKLAARKTVTEPLLKAASGFNFSSLIPSFGSSNSVMGVDLSSAAENVFAPDNWLGSFAVGHPNIPRDGLAMLHKGERVVTAADNRALMAGGMSGVSVVVNNYGSEKVTQQTRRRPDGGEEIEFMIGNAVAKQAATPGSAMDRTLSGRGARPPLVPR